MTKRFSACLASNFETQFFKEQFFNVVQFCQKSFKKKKRKKKKEKKREAILISNCHPYELLLLLQTINLV